MIGKYTCRECNSSWEDEQDPNKLSNIWKDQNGEPLHGGPPLYCPICMSMYMTWTNYDEDFKRKRED